MGLRSLSASTPPLTWSLFKQPEALTEVYFSDHKGLPAVYTPGEAYTISFTIANKEGQAMAYRFEIIQEGDTGRIVHTTDIARIESGQAKAYHIPIQYIDTGPNARIIVALPDQDQTLHYFVKRKEP